MSFSPPATGSEDEPSPMDLGGKLNEIDLNIRTATPDIATVKGPESPLSTNTSSPTERSESAAPLPPNASETGMCQQEPPAKASPLNTPVALVPASTTIATNQKKREFILVQPLLPQQEMNLLSEACRNLHATYMELAKQDETYITVAFKQGDFFHAYDGGKFRIFFEDLPGFFKLLSIESSFLRCWTLCMMTQAKQCNEPIGFLDPYVVSEAYIRSNRIYVIQYVTEALQHQQDKDHVMFAYTQGNHWITVVIALRHSKAYYLDSLKSGGRDFTPIREVLDHAFTSFVTAGGRTKQSKLKHIANVPCHQQNDLSELCGFYTMFHMELVANFLKTNDDILQHWQCSSGELGIERIRQMRGYVSYFINAQVINPEGEFHVVVEHNGAQGSPPTSMPHSSYDFSRRKQSNTTKRNVRSFSDGSDDEDDMSSTFTKFEAWEHAKNSKVGKGGVKKANIPKQPERPRMDHEFLEAVRNDEAANFRRLLNLPEPPATIIDHQVIYISPDREASNNDKVIGRVETSMRTSMRLDGSSPSNGGYPPAAEIVALPPQSRLLLQGVTSDGDGVLHIAARFECINIVREIPKSWSDTINVAAGNKRGETALHCAAATDNVDMITLLISLAGDDEEKLRQLLRMRNHNGETCLHNAVWFGKRKAVERLVQEDVRVFVGPNDSHALVRIHDNEGVSPLYLATTLRQFEIVKFLTDKQEHAGVQYPAASYYGPGSKTALHAAVLLSKELSEHLADWNTELIEIADESGSTPLHLLASTTLDKIVVEISPPDHLPLTADESESTPDHLLVATMYNIVGRVLPDHRRLTMDTVILLLKMDESAGYRADNEGSLPIHVAAANGNFDVVKLLSECRPNCSWSYDNLGQTILHIAVKNESSDVVEYVCSEQKFARILNTRDANGNTALHLAVLQGNLVIFCRLMGRRGVCLSFTNKEERTPLDLAQLNLPLGISALFKGPRQWIMHGLAVAGADYGTCRSDRLASKVAKPDEEKESESIGKSAGVAAVCAVLILTTSFAAPFAVTNYYSKTETSKLRSVAYHIFGISDFLAFLCSVVAIFCATISGFHFFHRETRLFFLPAGVSAIGLAAMFLIFVFTAGMYVAVGPFVHIWPIVVVALLAYVALGIATTLVAAPFLVMRAVISRFGFLEVYRRALDRIGSWSVYPLRPAYRRALDRILPQHRPPQTRRDPFLCNGGTADLRNWRSQFEMLKRNRRR